MKSLPIPRWTKTKGFCVFILVIGIGSLVFFEYPQKQVKLNRLAHLEKLYLKDNHPITLPSMDARPDENRPECFEDRYEINQIRREIQELFKENELDMPYNGEQTQWRGIALQGLPMGHVNYFLEAERFLSDTVDVSGCQTAPCVFNTIYNAPEDDLKGYVAFLFFLKTGYVLSGIARVPHVSFDDPISLSSYYWKDNEFYHFWLWMQSHDYKPYSSRLFDLGTLNRIYRYPHGYRYSESDSFFCGWARSLSRNSGYIWLSDNCLQERLRFSKYTRNENNFNNLRTNAIHSIGHEVGHHYDFSNAPLESWYLSLEDDFLSLSGWEMREYSENEYKREWITGEGEGDFDDFLRPYSQDDPQEDFADAISSFRFYPETLKRLAPRKFEYVKEHAFQGRSYDRDGLSQFYREQALSLIQNNKRQWLLTCTENPTRPSNETLSQWNHLDHILRDFLEAGASTDAFDCFVSLMDLQIKELEAELKFEEIEACSFFKENETWWLQFLSEDMEFYPTFSQGVQEILRNIEVNKQRLAQIEEFEREIARYFNGEEIVIACHNKSSSPETCFQEYLERILDRILANYNLLDERTLENVRSKHNTPSRFKTLAEDRIRRTVQITTAELWNKARDLVGICSRQSENFHLTENLYLPYPGPSDITLQSWFLNCVNANYSSRLSSIFSDSHKAYLVLDPTMRSFIDSIYHGDFLSLIDIGVRNFVQDQKQEYAFENQILRRLREDASWYTARMVNETVLEACLRRSQELMDSLTHAAVFQTTDSLSPSICSRLSQQEPYRTFFNENLAGLYGQAADILWANIVSRWNQAKRVCRGRKLCLSWKIIPIVRGAWSELNREQLAQFTRQERRRLTRILIMRVKNFLDW